MLYALYLPDGSIHQANKVYDADGLNYDDQLNDLGHKFVKANSPGLLPPDHWFVDVSAKEIRERPVMPVTVSKTRIRPGEDDCALFKGVPNGAIVECFASNVSYQKVTMDGTELEYHVPAPGLYRVQINHWPYKTFNVEIEAV